MSIIVISRGARTPEYFGCLARLNKQKASANPYPKDDDRAVRWLDGFCDGKLEAQDDTLRR